MASLILAVSNATADSWRKEEELEGGVDPRRAAFIGSGCSWVRKGLIINVVRQVAPQNTRQVSLADSGMLLRSVCLRSNCRLLAQLRYLVAERRGYEESRSGARTT